jgi:hypothetical protein
MNKILNINGKEFLYVTIRCTGKVSRKATVLKTSFKYFKVRLSILKLMRAHSVLALLPCGARYKKLSFPVCQ